MNCSVPKLFDKGGNPISPPRIDLKSRDEQAAAQSPGRTTTMQQQKPVQKMAKDAPSVASDASETISTLSMNSVVGRTRRAAEASSSAYDFKHDDEQFTETAKQILRFIKDAEKDPANEAILKQRFDKDLRLAFVKAVRFRVKLRKMLTDVKDEGAIDRLVQECENLGLGKSDHTNILIKSDLKKFTVSTSLDASSQRPGANSKPELHVITENKDVYEDMNRQASPMRIRPMGEYGTARPVYQNAARGTEYSAVTQGMANPGRSLPNYGNQSGPMFPSPTNGMNHFQAFSPPINTQFPGMSNGAYDVSRAFNPNLQSASTGISYYTNLDNSPADKSLDSAFKGRMSTSVASESKPLWQNGKRAPQRSAAKGARNAARLIRELKEAEQLMESSYSPHGEKFWKKQIAELKSKLQEIGADVDETPPKVKPEKTEDDATVSTLGSEKPQEVSVTSKQSHKKTLSDDDVFYPVQAASERMTVVYMKKNDPKSDPSAAVRINGKTQKNEKDTSDGTASKSGSAAAQDSNDKTIPLLEALDLPKAKVVAPANLPEGYTFEARVGNKRFMATVPPGGVSKGEAFYTYMKELDKVEVIVPVGEWRDDLCDICSFGPCHPVLLNSCFFPYISLGQVMSRSSLDYKGHEAIGFLPRQSCVTMAIITYSVWFLNALIIAWGITEYVQYNEYIPRPPLWISLLVINLSYTFFFWYATCSTRHTLRARYMIPERRCRKCEDMCCATFCNPCTIAQMNRHTGDFSTFRALCCSATGMPKHVNVPVNPDAKQVYDYEGPNISSNIV